MNTSNPKIDQQGKEVAKDTMVYGIGVMKDGKRIDPRNMYIDTTEKRNFWLLTGLMSIAAVVWMFLLNAFTKWVLKRRDS
jgi:hypothetical protein